MRGIYIIGLCAAAGGIAGAIVYAIYKNKQLPPLSPSWPGVTPSLPTTPTQPMPLPTCPPRGERVLLIGDSLVGDTPTVGLRARMAELAKGCEIPFAAQGVVGSHVTQWAQDAWLQPALRLVQPTLVLLSMGTNDYQRSDPENVRAGIQTLAGKIKSAGARLIWIAPPAMPIADAVGVRQMWLDQVGELNTIHSEMIDIPRGGDKIHPTMAGYKLFAEYVWAQTALKTYIAPPMWV